MTDINIFLATMAIDLWRRTIASESTMQVERFVNTRQFSELQLAFELSARAIRSNELWQSEHLHAVVLVLRYWAHWHRAHVAGIHIVFYAYTATIYIYIHICIYIIYVCLFRDSVIVYFPGLWASIRVLVFSSVYHALFDTGTPI